MKWLFWRKRKPAAPIIPEMPELGSRELVEYWGQKLEEARRHRSEAMAAYQASLKGKG